MLLGSSQQIISAYEVSGLTPKEIAESLDKEESAVLFILQTESSLYRQRLRNDDESGVSHAEVQEMLDIIKTIARTQRVDAPGVALKAAQYVHNEGKGRNSLKGMVGGGININIINQRLVGMRAARERAMKEGAVDVESKKEVVNE